MQVKHQTATLTSVVLTLVSFLAPIGTNLSYHSYGMPLDTNRDIHIARATGGDDFLLECDIARDSGVGRSGQADSGRKEALIDGGGGEGDARFHCLPVLWAGRLPFAGEACC